MKRTFHLLLWGAVTAIIVSCCATDKPPSTNTPPPPPHNGVFVNGKDTLWMNGDGKSIKWHFEKALPEIGAKGSGEYVFLLGHGKYRYDVAEYFRIIDTAHNNAEHQFRNIPGGTSEGFTILRDDQNHKEQTFKRVK